ncbi:hypothetical protein MASR2M8_05270 [Opitutaceae bacterium]
MKFNAALAKSVLMAASIGLVIPVMAQPAIRPAAARQGPAKEEEEEGVIDGIAIARPDGRWLGVTVEGLNLKVTFYDKKKMPEAIDVLRGNARWRLPTIAQQERAVLNPGPDGKSLIGNRPLRKPWTYPVAIVLVNASEEVVETHQVQLSDTVVPAPK